MFEFLAGIFWVLAFTWWVITVYAVEGKSKLPVWGHDTIWICSLLLAIFFTCLMYI